MGDDFGMMNGRENRPDQGGAHEYDEPSLAK